MKRPKIGAHVSVAGGVKEGVRRAKEIEAECMQIFAGTPRRYDVKIPEKTELDINPVFIHAPYLLNLASEDIVLRQKSSKCLYENLLYADAVGAFAVVYHPGSPKGGSKEVAIEREADSIKEVLEKYKGNALLLLENTAGEKKIGTTPSEMGLLVEKISRKNIGVCIDTAHSFQAGVVDFTEDGVNKWAKEWDDYVGLSRVFVLHVNDSITEKGSQHDRHANIGEGLIGKEGFSILANSGHFSHIPWIIETPGFDGSGPDKKNIDILKSLF